MFRVYERVVKEEGLSILGERLRTEREKQGLSIRELARRSGVRHATIVRLEAGGSDNITTDTLLRLCRTLRVSTDYLLGMWEEMGENTEEHLWTAAAL